MKEKTKDINNERMKENQEIQKERKKKVRTRVRETEIKKQRKNIIRKHK